VLSAAGPDILAQYISPADVSGRVVYSDKKEWLYSNLLKVIYLPKQIYGANTTHRFPGPLWAALRRAGGDIGPEWLLTSKRITSFRDLREPPWNTICKTATIRTCDTQEWAETDDPDQRRDFVRLLNHCLRGFTRSLDIRYHKELDCYYFPATADLTPRSLNYRSLQQKASRDVFAVYRKKSNPEVVSHYRHSAFIGSFQRYGREWYLQITPNYLYTVDGYRVSRFQGEMLAGIKRFDRNAAVVGQVAMWGDYLTPDQRDLFGPPTYPYLRFGKLERFQVNRTIDDSAWLPQDSTAPEQEGGEADERPLPDEL
jgi:hypothetical protein